MTDAQKMETLAAWLLEERWIAVERAVFLDKVCHALGLTKERVLLSSRERQKESVRGSADERYE